jgi:hypothetical protein
MSDAFARRTLGPPVGGTTDTNKGALIADAQTPALEFVDSSGSTHGVETTTLLLQAQTALTAITTAQTLFTLAFLAGALNKTNRALRVRGMLILASSNSVAVTIALKLGTVTLITIPTAAISASASNAQLYFDFLISVASAGSSGTLEAHGTVAAQLGSSNTTALSAQYGDTNTNVSSAVNLTSALNLVATIAAASSGISSAQVRQLTVEAIN